MTLPPTPTNLQASNIALYPSTPIPGLSIPYNFANGNHVSAAKALYIVSVILSVSLPLFLPLTCYSKLASDGISGHRC